MKKIQLRKRLDLLKKILKINNIDRKQFFQKCSSNCINTLCEACYNLLWNNFKFKRSKIKNINKTLSGISNDFQNCTDTWLSFLRKIIGCNQWKSEKLQLLTKPLFRTDTVNTFVRFTLLDTEKYHFWLSTWHSLAFFLNQQNILCVETFQNQMLPSLPFDLDELE